MTTTQVGTDFKGGDLIDFSTATGSPEDCVKQVRSSLARAVYQQLADS